VFASWLLLARYRIVDTGLIDDLPRPTWCAKQSLLKARIIGNIHLKTLAGDDTDKIFGTGVGNVVRLAACRVADEVPRPNLEGLVTDRCRRRSLST
tara:strand:+ start:801 stop:1088 length:288 start_codon:yes stop_codon:yes gene_type:complete